MDTGKTLYNDGSATKMTGLECGMLTGTSLAVVLIPDSNPVDAVSFVPAGCVWDTSPFFFDLVLHVVGFLVLRHAHGNFPR